MRASRKGESAASDVFHEDFFTLIRAERGIKAVDETRSKYV